ncbi:2-aminoadipate transaminase [Vibrio thalassae]|uniref:2-aminoadipate transaminase n=1 Tax=Vibrio thalassae TaxID=1243014 RepID=A0A240EG02_9VIBR|nr:PLP-dependent aminotransferase family protein [Vibrio thalassae]SNX47618.1 2-aminoadipate transaminase [Vibrio thalassae]
MEIARSLQNVPSSYIREILSAASDPSVISLAGGLPDPNTFPIELMRPTFEAMCDKPEVFQYGTTAGYAPLVNFLMDYYQLLQNHSAVICTGSQQGLDLVARAYINPGDTVVMEAPSYLGAMQVFGLVSASIVTVSQVDSGPNLEQLEACFKAHSPKMFYAVPDFHNPTGVCWSLETRKKVAELCIEYDVAFIEDAPYRELRFTGEVLPLVSTFCPDHSIVFRSFSKIASPGLRIGVVTGKKSYIDPIIKIKQGADLHSSIPMQAALLGLLKHPDFDEHLTNVKAIYKARYQTLHDALNDQLPASCTLNAVDGGMFIWVGIPQCDTFELARELLSKGVAVVPSPVFYPDAEGQPSALRLNFTNSSPEELVRAVEILSKELNRYC